jgi:hypothetical protein
MREDMGGGAEPLRPRSAARTADETSDKATIVNAGLQKRTPAPFGIVIEQ